MKAIPVVTNHQANESLDQEEGNFVRTPGDPSLRCRLPGLRRELVERAADPALRDDLDRLAGQTLDEL
jgi:hypothetical protein